MAYLRKRPFLTSLIIYVIWTALVLGGGVIATAGSGSLDDLVRYRIMLYFLLVPILLLVVVFLLKWVPEVALKRVANPRDLWILWLPVFYLLVFGVSAVVTRFPGLGDGVIWFVLINTLLVGINEELMFRGLLFYGSGTRFGLLWTVVLTAVLFGSVHILNGFITCDFSNAMIQATGAALSGVWYAALRFRLGSVFPGMILHWLWDFLTFLGGSIILGGLITPRFGVMGFVLVMQLPLALYGVWLLRKYRHQTPTPLFPVDAYPGFMVNYL